QGAASFKIWTKEEPPVEVMENAVRDALIRGVAFKRHGSLRSIG
ncbi:MAG: hypothetical protein KAT65_20305, partial [Methanophagales archaeon]|nr:hypothetical protein [Methanophagales archaeon]